MFLLEGSGHVYRKNIPPGHRARMALSSPCHSGRPVLGLDVFPPKDGPAQSDSPRLFPPRARKKTGGQWAQWSEQWDLLQDGGRQTLALGSTQSPSLAAYPAVCRPAVCRTQGTVLRESQASPQIMAQQLWNTLNREKDSWGTPACEGACPFHPSDSGLRL